MKRRLWAAVVLALFTGGCVTEYNLATQQEERLIYGTEKEEKIGAAVAAKIEEHMPLVEEQDVNQRLERILRRIVAVCDRKDIVYTIKAIDTDRINAVSLPGGYIYVYRGLLGLVENDDQLAGVIAHEVGHITAKHGLKRQQAAYGALFLQMLSLGARDARVAQGVNTAINSLFMQHSQEAEFEADRLSVKYLRKAGYDLRQIVIFLRRMEEEKDKGPIRPYSYWKTHPNMAQRRAMVNKEITGRLEFKDYIQLIDRPNGGLKF